jgi:hypothetical protein
MVVWNLSRGDWLAMPVFVVWCVLTLPVLAVFVRWAFRWTRVGGVKRAAAVVVVLLVVLFFGQRLIAPGSEEHQIEDAIEMAATSDDPDTCRELRTETFLQQSAGVPAPYSDDLCEIYAGESGADSVRVSEIRVDGDRATATVYYEGGDYDGSRFVEELVEEGADWKLNRTVEVQLDRDGFDRGYRQDYLDFGSTERAADCAIEKAGALSDERIEEMLLSGNPRTYDLILVECDRRGAEAQTIESLVDPGPALPRAAVACVRETLRGATDEQLARILGDPLSYGLVLADCDRESYIGGYYRRLVESDEFDSAVIDCTVEGLRALTSAALVRIGYDEAVYERLLEDCGA